MKQTVNLSDFREAFRDMDRADQFSYAGLESLFDYLTEYEDSCGVELELDVIALCCDFQELTLDDVREQYDIPADESVLEWLQDRTTVINVNEQTIIVEGF